MRIILGLVVAIAALNIISGIVMLVKNKTPRHRHPAHHRGQPVVDPAHLLHGRRLDRRGGHARRA